VAHVIGERKQYIADGLIGLTEKRLSSLTLFVSDGLKFYARALIKVMAKEKCSLQLEKEDDPEG
jgi:hypothetical protein